MSELAILGGRVVSGGASALMDVLARDGRIVSVRKPSRAPVGAARVIDARGLIVLPGIIDSHVHFRLRMGPGRYTADDFTSGSAAAACGGVTTFIDYTGQGPGEDLVKGLKARRAEAEGRVYADFSLHCQLTGWKALRRPEAQMAAAMKAGAASFKVFTAYSARGMMSDDGDLAGVLKTAGRLGALVCVHAENGQVIDYLTELFAPSEGIRALPLAHPDFTETEAVGRVVRIAAGAGAPVYFVHLSSGGSADIVAAARRAGLKVMAETCPQYLELDDRLLSGRDGYLYSCCPPIRRKEDNARLWKALKSGDVQSLATDNCTFSRAQKDAWNGDIRRLPMGMPGAQTLLPAAYTYGVKAGRISLKRLVKVLCEDPARIMGVPGKGFIRPGFDADFAIIDPSFSVKADWRTMKHAADFSPWQGRRLYGVPKYTVLRGEVVAEAGQLYAPGVRGGRFVARRRPEFI